MKELCGWAGTFLRIDLTAKTFLADSLLSYAPRFIGGRGLASRLYWDEAGSAPAAFAPDNTLYFMNGPLAGMHAPGASRWVVLGTSPMAMACDTADKKAEAAILNQNRSYAMENMVYCDWFWPIEFSANSPTGVGDPTLEARLFSALTGMDLDLAGYLRTGERSVNLCRAIYLREGRRGRTDDVLEPFNYSVPLAGQDPPIGLFNPELHMPTGDGEIRSRLGAIVEPAVFARIMDDYYRGRGWDVATGLFTRGCLERLELLDMIDELGKKGFIR